MVKGIYRKGNRSVKLVVDGNYATADVYVGKDFVMSLEGIKEDILKAIDSMF